MENIWHCRASSSYDYAIGDGFGFGLGLLARGLLGGCDLGSLLPNEAFGVLDGRRGSSFLLIGLALAVFGCFEASPWLEVSNFGGGLRVFLFSGRAASTGSARSSIASCSTVSGTVTRSALGSGADSPSTSVPVGTVPVPARPPLVLKTISSGLSTSGPNAWRTLRSNSASSRTKGKCKLVDVFGSGADEEVLCVVRSPKNGDGRTDCRIETAKISGASSTEAADSMTTSASAMGVDASEGAVTSAEGVLVAASALAARAAAILCASLDNGFVPLGPASAGSEPTCEDVGVDALGGVLEGEPKPACDAAACAASRRF